MFSKLYNKCLKLASHKSANLYLSIVSFAESSFFPVPPDLMIVPMAIAKNENYLKIFLNATIFSVLGGLFGYLIGFAFVDLGMNVVEFYGYEEKVNNLKLSLSQGSGMYAWLGILFLAGFTPLPFKVFTITSGLIGFNIFTFIMTCLIARGLRFFLVSLLSAKFGEHFANFIKKKGPVWSSIIGVVIVIFFLIIYLILK
tara:strand:- start:43 stop:639 length:597 start_codon:yes stop_codon:yes gene_type:complete